VDEAGNVYLSGYTQGSLAEPNAGRLDVYVRKYTPEGTLAWTRQWGTSDDDLGYGISADRMGNVYVTGFTGQGVHSKSFVRKYSTDGNLAWDRQLIIDTSTCSYAASADGLGNVYVSGIVSGSGYNAFVSKYTDDGTLAWTRIVDGGQYDYSYSVSADGLGHVYVSGIQGDPSGDWDVFVSKYSDTGDLAWTRPWSTSTRDMSYAVSADKWGNVFVAGGTNIMEGASYGDALVAKFTAEGDLAWDMQLGSDSDAFDGIRGAAADGLGNVYLAG